MHRLGADHKVHEDLRVQIPRIRVKTLWLLTPVTLVLADTGWSWEITGQPS